jgi:hypothetical protein
MHFLNKALFLSSSKPECQIKTFTVPFPSVRGGGEGRSKIMVSRLLISYLR